MIPIPSFRTLARRARSPVPDIAGGLLALLLLAPGAREARAQLGGVDANESLARPDTAAVDTTAAVPQIDLLDVFGMIFGRERREPELSITPKPGLSITLLPSIGYNPSYGGFIGVSAAVGGWLGDPKTTTLSAGSAGVSISTKKQLSVQFRSDFYTPDNAWAFKGDWRYLDTNQPTFGLGPATSGQTESPMKFLLYRFYQTAYWHVPKSQMYAGFGYHYDRWDEIEETDVPAGTVSDYQHYSGGKVTRATSSGVSFNALYDTRDNPINARRGTYWNASLRCFMPGLGSDDSWQSVWSDFRAYPNLPRGSRNTLALWNYAWFTFGHAPYLNLPASAWDTYGRGSRGWLQGRIRGPNQIYTETEYRVSLTRDGLLGGVMFLNLTSTTSPGAAFSKMDPGYGIGGRLKYNKRTSTNLAVDLAFDKFAVAHLFFGMQEVF